MTSCDALKPAQKTDTGDDTTDNDDVFIGNNQNNNNSNDDSNDGEDIVREVSKPEKPDTLVWTPVNPNNDSNDPIDPDKGNDGNDGNTGNDGNNNNNSGNDGNDGNDGNNNNTGDDNIIPDGITKSSYDVAVLLPLYSNEFKSSGQIPSRAKRSINYYEGMLMGLRRVEAEGGNMKVHVFDTKANSIEALASKPEVADADLIIGPVSSNNVRLAAQMTKANQQLLVSLNSSEGLTNENPYFIQASPSLQSHCETVVSYFKTNYPSGNIVLMGRGDETVNFPKYQEANMLHEGSSDATPLKEYIVTGSSSSYDVRGLNNHLSRLDTNIVIIPSGSQGFVYSMLRELSIIRRTYPIIVVGMPRWENFINIDPDYLMKLNVHISNSAYINHENFNIQEFKRAFFNEYGMPPTTEAYKGYDVALYFGRMLKEHGTGMLRQLPVSEDQMLHARMKFMPTYTLDSRGEGQSTVNQFENKYVHILRFYDFQFVKVND